jgi:hypothetical protein
MALCKALPTDFGIDASYWNILALQVNRADQTAAVTLAGYLDEPARRAGRRPIAVMMLTLAGDFYPGDQTGLSYGGIYTALRSAPQEDGSMPPLTDAADA